MIESDISTNTAADHHGKHHGTPAPDEHSHDGSTHTAESDPEDDKHRHHEDEN